MTDEELAQAMDQLGHREADVTAADQQQAAARTGGAAAPASGGGTDIDQLQQLADLHAQGILTDEEFAAKKAQILGYSDRAIRQRTRPMPLGDRAFGAEAVALGPPLRLEQRPDRVVEPPVSDLDLVAQVPSCTNPMRLAICSDRVFPTAMRSCTLWRRISSNPTWVARVVASAP